MNIKTKLATILLLIPLMSLSQIKEDKIKHFLAGGSVATFGYSASYYNDINKMPMKKVRRRAKILGIASATVVGTLKEVYDINRTGFDVADLAYTIGGGIVMTYTIDFLVGRKLHRQKVLIKRMKSK